MSAHEKGRPAGGGQSSSNVTSRHADLTPQVRWAPAPTHALAFATVVSSGRGVDRVDLHWRCVTCGKTHASKARPDLPAVIRRRGPHGPVLLHVVGAAAVAA